MDYEEWFTRLKRDRSNDHKIIIALILLVKKDYFEAHH